MSTTNPELDTKLAHGLETYLSGLNRIGSGERTSGTKATDDLINHLGYGGDDKPPMNENVPKDKPKKTPGGKRAGAKSPPDEH